MIERDQDRIIERSPAIGIHSRDCLFELSEIARERRGRRQYQGNDVIEIHNEHLIFRIAGLCESDRRCCHLGQIVAHASAMVHQQTNRHWIIFVLEGGDFLWNTILIDSEIFLRESGYELTLRVGNAYRHIHEIYSDPYGSLIFNFFCPLGGRSLGSGRKCSRSG